MRLWEQALESREDVVSAVRGQQAAVRLHHFSHSHGHDHAHHGWLEATQTCLGYCTMIHLLHILAASRWAWSGSTHGGGMPCWAVGLAFQQPFRQP